MFYVPIDYNLLLTCIMSTVSEVTASRSQNQPVHEIILCQWISHIFKTQTYYKRVIII